ncbi:hypothetical protein LJC57_10590, partial [Parabacteroides sp. OttesenSCG-928-G07]|nr:hypothetical protein [Parabacteroides sp. OttesenSCG-928-G07]
MGNNTMISRRKFFGTSATALAAAAIVPSGLTSCVNVAAPATPIEVGSKFNGVQIGAITYSWRTLPGGLANIIKYCKTAGLSSIELMSGDLEEYLGIPANPLAEAFAGVSRDPMQAQAIRAAN